MSKFLQFVIAAAAAFVILAAPHTVVADDQQSILVTGASTGIGRHLAETLAGNGYHVYAGARKDKDLAALDAIDNVTAVKLDVTSQDQVDAAVDMIRQKGTGLYAVVNNAGVGGGGEVIDTPIEDQTFVYAVNVEGVYRTTQAFAPLVIESKGRIVTTGSIAGTISAFPGFSAYSGSKHWIEAYTDSLAAVARSSIHRLKTRGLSTPSMLRASTARPRHSRRWLSNPRAALLRRDRSQAPSQHFLVSAPTAAANTGSKRIQTRLPPKWSRTRL